MAKHNTKIVGEQIEVGVAGDGLEWSSDAAMGIDLKANDGLEIDGGEITVDYDGSTIGIKLDVLAVLDGGIDTTQLAGDAVTGLKIADVAVDSEHIVAGAIDTGHIGDLQVTTGKLALDAVTGAQIADNAIDSEHYTDGSIDTVHIADSQVTNGKIANDTIAEVKLDIFANPTGVDKVLGYTANGMEWITHADTDTFVGLTDTPAAFAAHAGEGVKVNAGEDALEFYAIVDTDEKVKADAGASAGYLDAIVDGNSIEITAGDKLAVKVDNSSIEIDAVSHYIKVKALGIATGMIALDAVTGAQIADDAIGNEHLGNDCVDSAEIAALSIDTGHIADAQITVGKMAVNSVDSDQYIDGSIDLIHLSADCVDATKVADNAVCEEHLNCMDAAGDGEYLTWNNGESKFEWKGIDTDSVTEADFNFEDESAATNGSKVAFDLTNKPLASSCQVFLNGLLQQEGIGKDYQLAAGATPPTVTFGTAPQATDLLLIYYIQDD